jgi:beta-N-acetylhexosaminidase
LVQLEDHRIGRSARRVIALAVGLGLAGLSLVGCAPGGPPAPTMTLTPAPTHTVVDPIAGLSLPQRVGQLFMVGTTATTAEPGTLAAITGRHVGNVFLSGRSRLGVTATAAVVAKLRAQVSSASTAGVPLFVATDQEGGEVQVLQGSGFSAIPTGVAQGQLSAASLESSSVTWGSQLHAAGVNMDLAPVVDLVSSAAAAPANPPIGAFKREFGFNAQTIVTHANAFRQGMTASHVMTVIKHFPGLGFVTKNTDTSADVVDTVTGPSGVDVGIYRSEIAAGAACIMVSSATYKRIDASNPGVFSHTMVTGLLRDQLGFSGIIMTDDLSGAKQVASVAPGDRAIRAIEAGVDIVLVSKDPVVAAAMVDAVLAKAKSDPTFAALVDAAARRVVETKKADL